MPLKHVLFIPPRCKITPFESNRRVYYWWKSVQQTILKELKSLSWQSGSSDRAVQGEDDACQMVSLSQELERGFVLHFTITLSVRYNAFWISPSGYSHKLFPLFYSSIFLSIQLWMRLQEKKKNCFLEQLPSFMRATVCW